MSRFFQRVSKGFGKVLDPTNVTGKLAKKLEPSLPNPLKYGKDKKRAVNAAKALADAKAAREAEHQRLLQEGNDLNAAKDGLTLQLSELRAGKDSSMPANADRMSFLKFVRN